MQLMREAEVYNIFYTEMERFVLMSGITEYSVLAGRTDLLDDLQLIYNKEYRDVVRIRTLPGLTEQSWDYYKKLELTGLKEITLFNTVLNNLHKAIKELIVHANRKKQTERNPESVSDQSERTGTDGAGSGDGH